MNRTIVVPELGEVNLMRGSAAYDLGKRFTGLEAVLSQPNLESVAGIVTSRFEADLPGIITEMLDENRACPLVWVYNMKGDTVPAIREEITSIDSYMRHESALILSYHQKMRQFSMSPRSSINMGNVGQHLGVRLLSRIA